MKAPLWWGWLVTCASLVVRGNRYYALPPWHWRESARMAGVVYRACAEIRRERK